MATDPSTELLGQVRCPSGDLLLIDFGLLRFWSGDAVPVDPGTAGPPDTVDVEVVGPEARAVADGLALALVKGRFAFDRPMAAPGCGTWSETRRAVRPHRRGLLGPRRRRGGRRGRR